jgi:hypothetical protein
VNLADIFNIQDILCTVNVQHNCSEHRCGTANTRDVYQEREKTDQTRPVVSHIMPQDVVLNTAQMRDAVHVQKFRQRSAVLDADQLITESAAREVVTQKALQKASESIPAPKTATLASSRQAAQLRRVTALQEGSGALSLHA